MRRRVGELGHSHTYGLQDGGRCVRAIVEENDTRVVFVLEKKVYMLCNVKHFSCVFSACKSYLSLGRHLCFSGNMWLLSVKCGSRG